MKFLMLGATAMSALPMSLAVAQPQPPPPPTAPVQPLEYAVKFVCGRSAPPNSVSTLAPTGTYFTAVNVHNPNAPQEISHKVALADIGRPGRMTDIQTNIGLRYDEVIDFDCGWIRRRLALAGIPIPDLATGFLVIQSRRELDVVAVYTAAPTNTNQVSTMHTERVPVRRVVP